MQISTTAVGYRKESISTNHSVNSAIQHCPFNLSINNESISQFDSPSDRFIKQMLDQSSERDNRSINQAVKQSIDLGYRSLNDQPLFPFCNAHKSFKFVQVFIVRLCKISFSFCSSIVLTFLQILSCFHISSQSSNTVFAMSKLYDRVVELIFSSVNLKDL